MLVLSNLFYFSSFYELLSVVLLMVIEGTCLGSLLIIFSEIILMAVGDEVDICRVTSHSVVSIDGCCVSSWPAVAVADGCWC